MNRKEEEDDGIIPRVAKQLFQSLSYRQAKNDREDIKVEITL